MAFEDLKSVRLAADADTPAALLVNVGTIVMVPNGQTIPTTSGSTLAGIPGYGRMNGDQQEWVMAGTQDELLRQINRIPAPGVWTDTEARRVWRRGFDDVRGGLNSAGDLRTLATNLFRAAETELLAEGWKRPA